MLDIHVRDHLFGLKLFISLVYLCLMSANTGTSAVSSATGISWAALWQLIANPVNQNQINLRSSCPWAYVNDGSGHYANLYDVAKVSCIDLDRSTKFGVQYVTSGACHPIRAHCPNRDFIIGYTCVRAQEVPADKRYDNGEYFGNGTAGLANLQPTLLNSSQLYTIPAKEKEDGKKNEPELKDKKGKGLLTKKPEYDTSVTHVLQTQTNTPVALHQHLAPPFLEKNAQLGAPPYLVASGYQPGFLHMGLNPQQNVPPLYIPNSEKDFSQNNRGVHFQSNTSPVEKENGENSVKTKDRTSKLGEVIMKENISSYYETTTKK
ncbi:uncharacterized protein LOC127866888 isoform X2 [Dreissena polymorpha]|uniref:uncharacterized protein LOC127866888 isoform X2 n=1 Tax=Dreissena polymorpha TaxID=45954 RepID=UPI0022654140|nr:uncharacterized protein LOC127866888 isoform X2 [Dreissena polymorpha]